MTPFKKLWPLTLALGFAACGAPPDLDPGLVADDGELTQDDGKADGTAVSTYYWASRDLRRCASPMCGGYFVARVNKTTTKCADNVYRASCYVADLDFGPAGPVDAVLVRGTLAKNPTTGYGRFTATEAYRAAGAADATIPDGAFYRVRDRGLRCIHAPCPSFSRAKLNDSYTSVFDSIDLEHAGASDDDVAAAWDALYVNGVLAVGVVHNASGVQGRVFQADHLFVQVATGGPKTCYVGGCSSQICSDRPGVVSTCEARPEYGCYHTATCALQADGACGWTQTPALTTCIANAHF